MPYRPLLGCATVLLAMGGASLVAQTAVGPAAATVARARSLYYTPADHGLEGFRCDVRFDWKNFIQKAAKQAVEDDDPRLKYLRSIQLSIDDNLHGTGSLHWAAPGLPPDADEDSVARMRGGLQQLWSGFFQSWNGFFTGDLLTPDPASTVQAGPDGYTVTAKTGTSSAEAQYSAALVLQSVHVVTPTLDSITLPTFEPTANGLLVTAIRSRYRQPPTAEATELTMKLTYAPVNSYQIPATLSIAVGGTNFDFSMVNCTVQSRLSPPQP